MARPDLPLWLLLAFFGQLKKKSPQVVILQPPPPMVVPKAPPSPPAGPPPVVPTGALPAVLQPTPEAAKPPPAPTPGGFFGNLGKPSIKKSNAPLPGGFIRVSPAHAPSSKTGWLETVCPQLDPWEWTQDPDGGQYIVRKEPAPGGGNTCFLYGFQAAPTPFHSRGVP